MTDKQASHIARLLQQFVALEPNHCRKVQNTLKRKGIQLLHCGRLQPDGRPVVFYDLILRVTPPKRRKK